LDPLVILAVVLVFGLLVTFHEFGHYLLAKINGVRVLEFNVGFGPPLLQKTFGETTYGLRSVPLGGYVRLAGMDDGDAGPRSFNAKPVWRRLTIILAR
jgi:regulator of sigma E protease